MTRERHEKGRERLKSLFRVISRHFALFRVSVSPRPHRGQALVVFALLLVVVLGLAGLAIDGLRTAIAREDAQHAAEAAALAGAGLLPDIAGATASARAAAAQNGFTSAADVQVAAQFGPQASLTVTIQIHVPLTLGSALQSVPVQSSAAATAVALAPVGLLAGNNTAALSDPASGISPTLVGPYGDKKLGDPNVLCAAPGVCSPGTPGNPDHILFGYGGLATHTPFSTVPSGASYLITLPPGTQNAAVEVRGATVQDDLTGMAFSLYAVPQLYVRSLDVPIATIWPYSQPPNTAPAPSLLASQILASDALPSPSTTWVRLPATLSAPSTAPAYYRLTAENPFGTAAIAYATRVCLDTSGAPNCTSPGVTISAWNFATLKVTATTTTAPLLTLPAAYAGRQLALALFAPTLGSATITLTAPGNPTPLAIFTIPPNAGNTWLSYTLTVPPDYAGGTWQTTLTLPSTTTSAIFTIKADLIGPPVTLMPAT